MKKFFSSLILKTLAMTMIFSLVLSGCSGSLFLPIVEEYDEANAPEKPVLPTTVTLSVDESVYYIDPETDRIYTNSGDLSFTITAASEESGWSEYKIWEGDSESSDDGYTAFSLDSSLSASISYTLTDTAEGKHTVSVRLRNVDEDVSDTASAVIWMDTTAPSYTLKIDDSDVNQSTSSLTHELSFDGNISDYNKMKIWKSDEDEPGDSAYENFSDPVDITIAGSEGATYQYYSRVMDKAGNISSRIDSPILTYTLKSPTFTFTIDSTTTSAATTQDSTINIYTTITNLPSASETVYIAIWDDTETEQGEGYTIKSGDSFTHTLPAANGDYTVNVRIRQGLENYSSPMLKDIRFDDTSPEITAFEINESTTPADTKNNLLDIALTASDNLPENSGLKAKVWYEGQAEIMDYTSLSNLTTFTLPDAEDTYTMWAQVMDECGNESTTPFSREITYDTTAPSITTFICNDGTLTQNRTISFQLSGDSDITGYRIWDDSVSEPSAYTDWTNGDGDISYTLPDADGDHIVSIRIKDEAGNTSETSWTITYDSDKPPLSFLINSGDAKTNTAGVTLTVTTSSDVTGIKIWEGDIDSDEPSSFTAYSTASISYTLQNHTDGETSTIYMKVQDAAANESDVASAAIIFDVSVSQPGLVVDQGTVTASDTVDLTLTADNDVHEMKLWQGTLADIPDSYSVFSETIADFLIENAVSGIDYDLYLRVRDDAGNESAITQITVTYNSNTPEVTLTINGGDYASDSSTLNLTIAATAPEGTTVNEMKIWVSPDETEPSTWDTYSTTSVKTVSTEGTYQVNVIVRNDAEIESGTVMKTYIYDATAPYFSVPSLSVNGSSDTVYTNNTGLSLGISGVEDNIDVYEMKIWSGSAEPADTEYIPYAASTTTALTDSDATYTVKARFRDEAGNVSTILSSSSVVFDNTPPVLNLSANVSSPSNSDTVILTFGATDTSSMEVQYRADSDSFIDYIDYTNTWTDSLSARGEDEHLYTVNVRDYAGNVSTDSITIEYDNSAPLFSFDINDDDDETNQNGVTLNITTSETDISGYKAWEGNIESDEPADFEDYTSSSISYSLGSYSNGSASQVYLKLQDSAGNETVAKSDTIIFDNAITTPTISINQGSITAQDLIDLTLTADSDVSLMKLWHGDISDDEPSSYSSFTENYSDYELTDAVSGTDYTLYLKVQDDAGNVSGTAQATITYNADSPEVSLSIADTLGADSVTLDLTISTTAPSGTTVDGMKIWYTPGESEPSTWDTPVSSDSITLSTEDVYTINVKVKNDLGTESGTVSQEYIYDVTEPDVADATMKVNDSSSELYINNNAVILNFSGLDENIGVYQMKIWSGTEEPAGYESFMATTSRTLSSGEGNYIIKARFRDEAGNESEILSSATVHLDTTDPSIGITTDVESPTNADSVTLSFNATDASPLQIKYWADDDTEPAFSDYVASWTDDLTARGEGQHTYHVTLRDSAGNEKSAIYNLTYDITKPTVTLSLTSDAVTKSQTTTFTLTSSDAVSYAVWYDSDTRPVNTIINETFTTGGSYSLELPDSDGNHIVYASVFDSAGNESEPASVDVTLDRVAPEFYTLKIADSYNGSSITTRTDNTVYVSPIMDEGSQMKIWYQLSGEAVVEPEDNDPIFGYITFETNYEITLPTTGDYIFYVFVKDEAGNEMEIYGSSATITYTTP